MLSIPSYFFPETAPDTEPLLSIGICRSGIDAGEKLEDSRDYSAVELAVLNERALLPLIVTNDASHYFFGIEDGGHVLLRQPNAEDMEISFYTAIPGDEAWQGNVRNFCVTLFLPAVYCLGYASQLAQVCQDMNFVMMPLYEKAEDIKEPICQFVFEGKYDKSRRGFELFISRISEIERKLRRRILRSYVADEYRNLQRKYNLLRKQCQDEIKFAVARDCICELWLGKCLGMVKSSKVDALLRLLSNISYANIVKELFARKYYVEPDKFRAEKIREILMS